MTIITNLLANMVVVASNWLVPTNTPAFQHYALHAMVSNASYLAYSWHLDLPTNLTTNDVTSFYAEPRPGGIAGDISLQKRFGFRYEWGRFALFRDKLYTCQRLGGDDFENVMNEWLALTNYLNLRSAQGVAEGALLSVGLDPKLTGFKRPHRSEQWKHWTDGKEQDFPYFQVRWESSKGYAKVDVSGVASNIVEFSWNGFNLPNLRLPRPPNYLEMLGYSTNTVFVRPRVKAGHATEYEVYEP